MWGMRLLFFQKSCWFWIHFSHKYRNAAKRNQSPADQSSMLQITDGGWFFFPGASVWKKRIRKFPSPAAANDPCWLREAALFEEKKSVCGGPIIWPTQNTHFPKKKERLMLLPIRLFCLGHDLKGMPLTHLFLSLHSRFPRRRTAHTCLPRIYCTYNKMQFKDRKCFLVFSIVSNRENLSWSHFVFSLEICYKLW